MSTYYDNNIIHSLQKFEFYFENMVGEDCLLLDWPRQLWARWLWKKTGGDRNEK